MILVERRFHGILIVMLAFPAREILIAAQTHLENKVADRTRTRSSILSLTSATVSREPFSWSPPSFLRWMLTVSMGCPLSAGAGVAGIATGFAAQDTLSNLIAGVLLITERPFEIGNRIDVWSAPAGSATRGDVIDIGLAVDRFHEAFDFAGIVIPYPKRDSQFRHVHGLGPIAGETAPFPDAPAGGAAMRRYPRCRGPL